MSDVLDRRRLCSTPDYAGLKTATLSALAKATPQGSSEAFAPLTRVEPRTLRKYADHAFEMFVPLDVAADLDRACKEPIMARAIAQLSGCSVVALNAEPTVRVMSAIKETSEAIALCAQLPSSGAWGHEQAKAARREIREALAALAGLDAALSQRIEGRG